MSVKHSCLAGAEPLLHRVLFRCEQTAIGGTRLNCYGLYQSRRGFHDEDGLVQDEAMDDVAD
jgi:hypothetical protein